ncbi:CerR family C-terminal domain-containing protein [Parahaliea mediterranea]|uniref:CerR family C-terminal domain-containing protein n=1 Tax=Parahaliea mediterranea TaxID=651086 RepID=A0A939IL33_9GAMM|nr:CerR family C-terminal domain-containing protein [Parahaliea mediterranea]MBN7796065.1 CerR family C-terminal domain-containing protein [Parahaliea mediterranea]
MATKANTRQVYRQSNTGYSKSADTRKAILRAAIVAFGRAGYSAATTRQIADAAGVNQPAINYYFGGKDGLYQACAQEILDNFKGPLEQVSLRALEAIGAGLDRKGAARQLQELLSALAEVMILSEEVSEAAGFVGREMREPGLAYQMLYRNLWAPGIELAAALIAIVKGRAEVEPADRVDAIMMISGISAFAPGHSVSMQVMQWQAAGKDGKALVLERLEAQILGWARTPAPGG